MEQIACVPAHVSYFLCCTRKSNAAFTLGAKVRYSLGTNVNILGAGVRVQGLSWQVLFCFVLFFGEGVNFCAGIFWVLLETLWIFFGGGGGRVDFCPHSSNPVTLNPEYPVP